jgi:BolA protein
MSIEASIRDKVINAFKPEYMELENESHSHSVPANSETHFRLLVVSAVFEGKSRLDRQRLVNDLFADERARGLHALSLRTLTPAEWELVREDFEMTSPPCYGGSKNIR